tara:strand:+ start:302 stop:460 length:159 start_codon:yes stop_codon:yes gene_type:complete
VVLALSIMRQVVAEDHPVLRGPLVVRLLEVVVGEHLAGEMVAVFRPYRHSAA